MLNTAIAREKMLFERTLHDLQPINIVYSLTAGQTIEPRYRILRAWAQARAWAWGEMMNRIGSRQVRCWILSLDFLIVIWRHMKLLRVKETMKAILLKRSATFLMLLLLYYATMLLCYYAAAILLSYSDYWMHVKTLYDYYMFVKYKYVDTR